MMPIKLHVAGKSDVGCVRTNNEDNFGYDMRYGIFVVCDGMGGQAAGEVASKIGVDTVLNYFREAGKDGPFPLVGDKIEGVSVHAQALNSAMTLANQAVFETAEHHPSQQGMGSTIVSVLIHGSQFSIGHVGDSRIYLVRNGEIQQLTNDHSLVMEQVRRGYITREQAATSDMQNIILRALGSEATVQPDVDDLIALPGDTLVLCSDGLTRHLSDERMLEMIQATSNVQEACDNLISAAKDGGGQDNVTCLLIRVEEQGRVEYWLERLFGGGRNEWQNSF